MSSSRPNRAPAKWAFFISNKDALHELKWVKAIRAADGRTKVISLTRFGRKLFDLAFKHCVLSGAMPLEVDRALTKPSFRLKSHKERHAGALIATRLTEYFGWTLFGADDLYVWDLNGMAEEFEWPKGETTHFELRVAEPGMIDAPLFQAGDVLAEIED